MQFLITESPIRKITIAEDDNLSFVASMIHFTKSTEIKNCRITNMDIFGMYCLGGFVLRGCTVSCAVSWQSGGHNSEPIIFENCEFLEFIDFEDCAFEGRVTFRNVVFKKGTNLFGNKGTPVEVTFQSPPLLENVSGNLSVNTFHESRLVMDSETWTKLTELDGSHIGRATRFLIQNSPEYEKTVEFYLVEDPTSPSSYTLYVSTGHKAGCIRVKLPEEASSEGGISAISKSWLIQNWRKWVIDTDPQQVLCRKGYQPKI